MEKDTDEYAEAEKTGNYDRVTYNYDFPKMKLKDYRGKAMYFPGPCLTLYYSSFVIYDPEGKFEIEEPYTTGNHMLKITLLNSKGKKISSFNVPTEVEMHQGVCIGVDNVSILYKHLCSNGSAKIEYFSKVPSWCLKLPPVDCIPTSKQEGTEKVPPYFDVGIAFLFNCFRR